MSSNSSENRYAHARREAELLPGFADLINTNFHDCGLRIPRDLLNEVVREYVDQFRPYRPDSAGDPALRASIAGYYGTRRNSASPAPQSIVVTASASESYSHIFAAFCRPGDAVLLPRPGYPLFEDIADRSGLRCGFYDLEADRGWAIEPSRLESLVDETTRALVVISPNNPTGGLVDEPAAIQLGEICARHNLFLIVDEVFSEFVFDGASLPWIADLLREVPVFTINGVSKLLAAPDLKISWIVTTGPRAHFRVDQLQIVNDMFLSASPLSQFVAGRLLREETGFTASMVREVAGRRDAFLAEIARTPGLGCVPPRGGIHVPVTVDDAVLPHGVDDEDLAIDLLECGVGTHPGYLYSIDSPVTLVMSYLSEPSTIAVGFERIRSYLSAASSSTKNVQNT